MAYNSEYYESSDYYSQMSLSEYSVSPGIRAKFDHLYREMSRIKSVGVTFRRSLDIGCGGSPFSILLSCVQKVLVDLSRVALLGLKKENGVLGDSTFLPFRDCVFDVVIMTDVIEHIPDDKKAVREISRVSSNGGAYILTVPHREELWTSTDVFAGHFRRYTLSKLTDLLQEGEFRILSRLLLFRLLY